MSTTVPVAIAAYSYAPAPAGPRRVVLHTVRVTVTVTRTVFVPAPSVAVDIDFPLTVAAAAATPYSEPCTTTAPPLPTPASTTTPCSDAATATATLSTPCPSATAVDSSHLSPESIASARARAATSAAIDAETSSQGILLASGLAAMLLVTVAAVTAKNSRDQRRRRLDRERRAECSRTETQSRGNIFPSDAAFTVGRRHAAVVTRHGTIRAPEAPTVDTVAVIAAAAAVAAASDPVDAENLVPSDQDSKRTTVDSLKWVSAPPHPPPPPPSSAAKSPLRRTMDVMRSLSSVTADSILSIASAAPRGPLVVRNARVSEMTVRSSWASTVIAPPLPPLPPLPPPPLLPKGITRPASTTAATAAVAAAEMAIARTRPKPTRSFSSPLPATALLPASVANPLLIPLPASPVPSLTDDMRLIPLPASPIPSEPDEAEMTAYMTALDFEL